MNISLKGLSKAAVLCALYEKARTQGMGFLDPQNGETLSVEQAEVLLGRKTSFDYLAGRVMKIDLSGDELYTGLYDRDNGAGAAAKIIESLRRRTASSGTD